MSVLGPRRNNLTADDLILEEIDPVSPEEREKERNLFIRRSLLGIVGVSMFTAAVLLGVLLSRDGDPPATSTPAPVTSAPSYDRGDLLTLVLPEYSLELARTNVSSPQAKALAWLNNDPQFFEYQSYRLAQRYALAVLYYSTNGEWWERSAGWLSSQDECTWHSTAEAFSIDLWGPICQAGSRFSVLDLRNNSLGGTIPSELELLSQLRVMYLAQRVNLSVTIYPQL
jgi:hypothetical protein